MQREPVPFWDRVKKTATCWLWTGPPENTGYGRLWIRTSPTHRERHQAHRWSWILKHGPITSDVLVLHKCDVPLCVRPSHLYLGQHKDNAIDRETRGRGVGKARFTPKQVREIRWQALHGMSQSELGRKHGVSSQCIWKIVHRESWRRV